jgi:hypothetical protein
MWREEEVTFEDIDKPHAQTMAGYQKIIKCCQQATIDGFKWVWIDTCCIDKSSSAELSEAINSMYNWYWQAETCYAYLDDVDELVDPERGPFHSDFVRSRWFRRGWTLQELLAPPDVMFFNRKWDLLGTKHELYHIIKRATEIDERHIRHRETVYDASIGTVFSWAAKRDTRRPEDVAYCLLGFFRVNMPLLYGEGARAFYRLQLELLKQTEDHTIFAWNPQPGDVFEAMGILAPSPRQFQDIPKVEKAPLHHRTVSIQRNADTTYEMTNRGLRILLPRIYGGGGRFLAKLTVKMNTSADTLHKPCTIISLQGIGPDRYRRVFESRVHAIAGSGFNNSYTHRMYINAESRLRSTAALQKTSCPMTIASMHCGFKSCEIRGIAVYRKGHLYRWLRPDLEKLELLNNEWASIKFKFPNRTINITIGQHQHRVGLMVWHPAQPDSPADLRLWVRTVQKSYEDLQDHQQYFPEHITMQLDANVTVDLKAWKSRTIEAGPQWKVAINIKDERWGIPSENMAVLQKRLRSASSS